MAFLAHGGHGCISVTANVAPRLCARAAPGLAGRPAGRGAGDPPPPAAAAPGAVLRDQPGAGQICAEPARPLHGRGAAAAGRAAGARPRPRSMRRWRRSGCWAERPWPGSPASARSWHRTGVPSTTTRSRSGSRRVSCCSGTEVKSLREGRATISEAHAGEMGGELWLFNAYIPEFHGGNRFNHETRRPRKLMLRRTRGEPAVRRRAPRRA